MPNRKEKEKEKKRSISFCFELCETRTVVCHVEVEWQHNVCYASCRMLCCCCLCALLCCWMSYVYVVVKKCFSANVDIWRNGFPSSSSSLLLSARNEIAERKREKLACTDQISSYIYACIYIKIFKMTSFLFHLSTSSIAGEEKV